MRKFVLLGCCLAGLWLSGCGRAPAVAATPKAATVLKVAEVGLEYDLPEGWKRDQDGQLCAADDNLVVQFVEPPAGDDLKVLAARLTNRFHEVKMDGQMAQRSSNGLQLTTLRGSGLVEKKPTEWELILLEGGPRRYLMVVIAGGVKGMEKHRAAVDQLASSFKVTEGAILPPVASETPLAVEAPETPVAEETPAASETPEEE